MRKIITLLLILFINSLSVFAIDEKLFDEVLTPCEVLIKKAIKTNNSEDWIKACEAAYKLKKEQLNDSDKAIMNNTLVQALIKHNLERYDITHNKKYLKDAYNWTQEGVNNKTNDIYTIKNDISLASYFLDKKEMIKAFDLLNEVNKKEAENYYQSYQKLFDKTEAVLAERSANRKQELNRIIYALSVGLKEGAKTNAMYYGNYNNYNYTRSIAPTTSTTRYYSIGDTVYSQTTSY